MNIKSAKRAFEVGGVQFHLIPKLLEAQGSDPNSEEARLARAWQALSELDSEVRERSRRIFESEGLSGHGFSASVGFCYSSEADESLRPSEEYKPEAEPRWKFDASLERYVREDGIYFESILTPSEIPVWMWRVYWPVEDSSPMWINPFHRNLRIASEVSDYIDKNWPMNVEGM